MYRPFVEHRLIRMSGALLAALWFLGACSSSPTKDEPPAMAGKVDASVPGTGASPAEAPPAGPPPISAEATQQFEKALTLLGAGDYTLAAQELQKLAATYPDYSGPMANLGIVYLKTNKLPEAEKALTAATKRGEPSAAAFNQLGIVYRRMGKFKEADQAYSEALRIDPNYSLAHLNLGVLCDMYLQQPERALQSFERYLQLSRNPDGRVAGWVKELKGRVGGNRPAPAAAPANSSPESTGTESTASPTGSAGQ